MIFQPIPDKRCPKCGEPKPRDLFYNHSRSADGLQSRCKACMSSAGHDHYLNNKDKILAKSKQWKARNKERVLANDRQWRKTHPQNRREFERRYRETHPDAVKEKRKRYANKHKEHIRAKQRQYRAQNKD